MVCLGLIHPSTYCYKSPDNEETDTCRYCLSHQTDIADGTSCRYPNYVYQVDLGIQVTICLVFAFLAFYVIKWEKLLKENKWQVYCVSLAAVALIQVRPCTWQRGRCY